MSSETGPQQAGLSAQAAAIARVQASAESAASAETGATAKTGAEAGGQAKIGLVIPVYNRAASWQAAAESVLAQDQLPSALVIVDDGSSDNTLANIRQWLEQQDNPPLKIKLIQQPHKGASAARNRGLSYLRSYGRDTPAIAKVSPGLMGDDRGVHSDASSSPNLSHASEQQDSRGYDYIGFLDSDDILPPDFISRTYAELSRDEDAVAVSVPRASYEDQHIACDDLSDFAKAPLEWMLYYGAAILSCSLFRTAHIPEQGFDEGLEIGEDLVFATEVSLHGRWLAAAGLSTSFQRRTVPSSEFSSMSASESNPVSDAPPRREQLARQHSPLQASHEQQPLTQRYDPNEGLDAALLALAVRKRAVRIHNKSSPRRINSAYWQYILSMWYLLAARQAGREGKTFTRCRLFMRALLHITASMLCRLVGL